MSQHNPESVKQFGWDVQRLINGEGLSRERSYEMFIDVLLNQQPDLQQGAFLAALVAKGETPEEIIGAWQAIDEIDTTHVTISSDQPLVENCGTGMDDIKTFNVSTAAAIIAAACGVRLARHGARGLTSSCGTVDIAEALGVDVECDVQTVAQSVESIGLGLFNGMSPEVHPQALGRILSQIRFGSTLNIAASLANPARPTHALRGVYHPDLIPTVCRVMKQIGYHRALIVHGRGCDNRGGMDELSILGESAITELAPDGTEQTYTLTPEGAGLPRAQQDDITSTGDIESEATCFLQILAGSDHRACQDFACLNAAGVLYVAGHVEDIAAGVPLCQEAIADGSAMAKLREWIGAQQKNLRAGLARLETVARRAGVAV